MIDSSQHTKYRTRQSANAEPFIGKPMVVSEYSVILIALVFDMCLGGALLGISLAIAQSQGVCLNYSKVSSFECGFLNFSDARQKLV